VRERLLAARTEFEHETRDHRIELAASAGSSTGGSASSPAPSRSSRAREETLGRLEATLGGRETAIVEAERRVETAAAEQRARLEQISA